MSAPALWRVAVGGTVRLAAGPPDEGPATLLASGTSLDDLLARGGDALRTALATAGDGPVPAGGRVLCPLEGQEVWASGVTFERSRTARN